MIKEEYAQTYMDYCANNQGFKMSWRAEGSNKEVIAHYPQTIAAASIGAMNESDDGYSVTIQKVDYGPTWEGYLEWMQFNPDV